MLTLAAYFDESGTHAGSEAVAVAGYLATPEAWERFDVAWRAALSEWGLAFFHMSEFANRVRLDELGFVVDTVDRAVGDVVADPGHRPLADGRALIGGRTAERAADPGSLGGLPGFRVGACRTDSLVGS